MLLCFGCPGKLPQVRAELELRSADFQPQAEAFEHVARVWYKSPSSLNSWTLSAWVFFCDLHARDRTGFEFQARLRSELGLELKGREEPIPPGHTCEGTWVPRIPYLSVRPGRMAGPRLRDAGFKGFVLPSSA